MAASLALAGCATPQTDSILSSPGNVSPAAEIANAPFYGQRTDQCGPAALAMALTASGVKIRPDALVSEVYTPGRKGSLTTGLITAARRHGRLAYLVPNMRAMFREVDAGRPVVVLENLALPWVPQWHYAVVIGYDLGHDTVTLNSGNTPHLRMSMETFERTWARGNYWALLVLNAGELPVVPNRSRYIEASLGLEQTGQTAAALKAYKAGLKLWPTDLTLRMGLGNTLYAEGRLIDAEHAFARAAHDHPDAADAFNNLAQVQLDLGHIEAALTAGRTAVRLGGPNAKTYRSTLKAIMAKKSSVVGRSSNPP